MGRIAEERRAKEYHQRRALIEALRAIGDEIATLDRSVAMFTNQETPAFFHWDERLKKRKKAEVERIIDRVKMNLLDMERALGGGD